MRCLSLLVLFAVAFPAFAQQPPATASTRPILKALPLNANPGTNTRPPAARTVLPAQAVSLTPDPAIIESPAQTTPLTTPAAPVPPNPIDAKPTGDDAVRLQIFLDESKFGPGVIDGKPGRFTELAVFSWNEVNGHPVDSWTAVNTAARRAVPNPHAIALVPDLSTDWVDPELPYEKADQAKQKRMSYRSIGEFMSERYHCDVPYLIELNGSSKINNLKPRDTIIVPNVNPFQIERVTGAKYEADPALSARHVVVDTRINQARIFEAAPRPLIVAEPGAEQPIAAPTRANRGLIASFPITPGQKKFIKLGTWELRNMVELPWWRYDQKLLDTGTRGTESLNIPPGPNSPVGIIWNGTSKRGIGLHGTSNPETIGRARSAGCIRLANWDAIRLPQLVRPGTTVEIR